MKHNEEIISSQIKDVKEIVTSNFNWRNTIEGKEALNQLILLLINLNEMITEIETRLMFCSLNKIHPSIIDMKTFRKIVNQSTNLDYLEIAKLIKSLQTQKCCDRLPDRNTNIYIYC